MDNISSIKKELHNSENEDIVFLPNKKSKYTTSRNGEISDMQAVEQYDVHKKIKCEEKAQRKKKRKIKNMHTNSEGSDDNLDNGTKRKHKQRYIENKTELLDTAEQSNMNIIQNEDIEQVIDDRIKNVFTENKSVFCYIPNDCIDGGKVNNRDSNSENDDYYSDDSLVLLNDDFILQDMSVGSQNIENFKYGSVLITWEVPMQHTIESRITSRPNKKQLEEFEGCGVEMKHGPFSEQEDDLIRKNWIKFCEVHDFNNKEPQPFLMFKSGDEIQLKHSERLEFVRYLAKGLPNRFLYSIYQRFRIIYTSLKKGRFTVDEDEMILQYCNETGNKHIFATLGNILNRNRVAVYSRYKKLTTVTDNEGSMKWTQKLNEQFIQSMLRHCRVNSVEELSELTINNKIWTSIGEELNILPARVKIHWQMELYPCLFSKKSILLSDIRIKLVKMFKEAKVYSYRDIIWTEVAKFFDGLTPQFLYFRYYRLIYTHVPRDIRKNCRACNKYLYKNLIPIMREAKYDRVLNHYTYSKINGLVMIDDQ